MINKKFKKNPWVVVSLMLFILAIISLSFLGFHSITGNYCMDTGYINNDQISEEEASKLASDFIQTNFVKSGTVQVDGIIKENDLYKIYLIMPGQEGNVPIYLTVDGEKVILSDVIDISEYKSEMKETSMYEDMQAQEQKSVPKAKKPTVEFFVMSLCYPCSVSLEPMMPKVFNQFEDKIDFKPIYVVSEYNGEIEAHHGESEVLQNMREKCVYEEYGMEKWFEYLNYVNKNCLRDIRRGGDVEACYLEATKEAGIDSGIINQCVESQGLDLMKEDAKTTAEHRVSSSPVMFVNGVQVTNFENEDSLKNIICSSFENMPEECI